MKKTMNKKLIIGLVLVIIFVAIGSFYIASFLPTIGDLKTPANSYISAYFIENAYKDTHAQNIVTAVLADYRGFDTLYETCVMFLSGITALTILSTKEKTKKENNLDNLKDAVYGGMVLDAAFRIVVPFILIYAIYVLIHGEISLGGGFQAGALLACAYLLDRIVPSVNSLVEQISEEIALIIAGVGVFIYMFTGILPMFNGGNFLEYAKLPFKAETVAELHASGILMIEIGVTLAVMGVVIAILELVLERTDI